MPLFQAPSYKSLNVVDSAVLLFVLLPISLPLQLGSYKAVSLFLDSFIIWFLFGGFCGTCDDVTQTKWRATADCWDGLSKPTLRDKMNY